MRLKVDAIAVANHPGEKAANLKGFTDLLTDQSDMLLCREYENEDLLDECPDDPAGAALWIQKLEEANMI